MGVEQAALLKGTLLVVDDDLTSASMFATLLRKQGYAASFATDGETALRVIHSELPNLVLLDVLMPGMTGYEVCQRIKADDRTRHIPVIFLSALGEVTDKVKAFEIGGADFIQKPFQIPEVLARIEHQLSLMRLHQMLNQQKEQLAEQNQQLQQEIHERQVALRDRKRAEEELAHERALLRCLIDSIPDLIFYKDQNSLYLACNRAFEAFVGKPKHEIIGRTDLELFPIQSAEFVRAQDCQALTSGQALHHEEWAIYPDGSRRLLDTLKTPFFDTNHEISGLIGVCRDITARKTVELELQKKSEALACFSNSLKHLHRLSMQDFSSLEELFAEYIRTGCEVLNFPAGAIGQVQDQSYVFLAVQSDFQELVANLTTNLADTYCGKVVEQNTTVAFDHIGQMAGMQHHQLYQTLKLESYLGTPILVDGSLYGTICFFSTQPRSQGFESHEKEIIELMAQSIGKFISLQQVEARRRQAEEEVQLLLNLTQAIAVAADFNQASEIALRYLCEVTGWTYGEIWLPSGDGTVLERSPIYYCNPNEQAHSALAAVQCLRQMVDAPLRPNEGIAGRVWSQQQPEWMADIEAVIDPGPRRTLQTDRSFPSATQLGLKAHFGVPIMVTRDRTLSPIQAQNPDSDSSVNSTAPTVLAVLVFFIAEPRSQDERLAQLVSAVAAQLGMVLAQKQTEAELQALFQAMTDTVVVRDARGRCLKIAPTTPYLDQPVSELVGKTLHETFPKPTADLILQGIQSSLQTQQTVDLEYCLPIRSQDTWLSARIFPLSENSVILVARDISDRKQAEEAIRRTQRFLDSIIENLPNMVFVKSAQDLRFIRFNKAGEELLGIGREELLGKNDYDLFPENEADFFTQCDREVLMGQVLTDIPEEPIQTRHQGIRLLHTKKIPILDDTGMPRYLLGISEDITEHKQAEETLRQSEERFRAIFDNAPVGIALVTLAGQFIRLNQWYCTWSGYSEAELLEKTLQEIVAPDDLVCDRELVRRVLAGEILTFSVEKRYVHKNGHPLWANLTACLVRDAHGIPQGFIHVIEDIQERKQAEEALQRAKEAAETANRTKSEFLANMSHELRTPLNVILGFAQVMVRESSLTSQVREYLATISRSGEHLLDLINDVLEMSKIEAGRVSLNPVCFNLYNLLHDLEEMLQLKAKSKGLQLIFNYAADVPQYIQTDESKLRQVLLNLLGNAIKFTPTGRVILRVMGKTESNPLDSELASPAPLQAERLTLYFEVEDTGPGIDLNELDNLFEPFVQSRNRKHPIEGTGLGLPISRQFVQLMGGTIQVHSLPEQGTIVRFNIQANPAESEDVQSLPSWQKAIALAPGQPTYRMLVVEDHPDSRQLLANWLRSLGFDVQEAANGATAIDLWQHWQPDLIWMDMRMPVMNGYETTRRIRSVETLCETSVPKTKIIALTASAFEVDRANALASGCDDFIHKPFREEILLSKVVDYLGVQFVYAESEQPSLLSEEKGLEPHLDREWLKTNLFSVMPPDWITQFHQAANLGSDQRLLHLLEQIPPAHSLLIQSLTYLVNNFCFEQLLDLIHPTPNKPESQSS